MIQFNSTQVYQGPSTFLALDITVTGTHNEINLSQVSFNKLKQVGIEKQHAFQIAKIKLFLEGLRYLSLSEINILKYIEQIIADIENY